MDGAASGGRGAGSLVNVRKAGGGHGGGGGAGRGSRASRVARKKYGLSAVRPALRDFRVLAHIITRQINLFGERTMTTTTPDTTRYFPHPAQFPSHTNEQYLQEAHGIAAQCWFHYADLNSRSYGTLYTGALGSLCYLRLKFADILPGKGTTLKALGCVDDAIAQAAKRSIRCTLLECPTTSALCLKLALLLKVDQMEEARSVANEILRLGQSCRSPVECLGASECEILYGRSGYLTAILWARHHLKDATFGRSVVVNTARAIIENGLATARKYQTNLPLLWEWHGSLYLGAAHGVVGILCTLLNFVDELSLVDDQICGGIKSIDLIRQTIDTLDNEQTFPSGNLRSSIGREKDKLVHWCHGAPGHVLLLTKAHAVFGEQRYLRRVETICDNVIYPRGLLKKGVGLCHGISGNAYCFLAVYRGRLLEQKREEATDNAALVENERFLQMARNFASFAIDNFNELAPIPHQCQKIRQKKGREGKREGKEDRPFSLFEGMAGLSLLLLDLQDPENAVFPCFEF